MRDAVGDLRVCRVAAYDVVRAVLGLLFLAAAALKGHQLATERVVETRLLNSRWFLMGVVDFEFFVALRYCGNGRGPTARSLAMACCPAYAALLQMRGDSP